MINHYKRLINSRMALGFMLAVQAQAGSLDPTNAPGPTMRTLEEIFQKQMSTELKTEAFVFPQTLSPTTTVVNAGYYLSTLLTAVDSDLVSTNIKSGVTIFGVLGTLSTNAWAFPCAVPKTGQNRSFAVNDDGYHQKGVAWPSPRFSFMTDSNCVMDNLTGLIWARGPTGTGASLMTWSEAINYCENLGYGGRTDWRMPNLLELQSLIDFGQAGNALPIGEPFDFNDSQYYYWTSTIYAITKDTAWVINIGSGMSLPSFNLQQDYHVWPVSGGQ